MKDFLNKITNLVRNKYAMQKFYFASLVALLLFYIPFSPLNYIDLESVWGLSSILGWVDSWTWVVTVVLACLWAAIPIFLIIERLCIPLNLPENSAILDILATHTIYICTVLTLFLPIIYRITPSHESSIIMSHFDHIGAGDIPFIFFSGWGAILTFAVFLQLLTGKHLADPDDVILGEDLKELQSPAIK